jgi:hypothetical protein
MQHHKNKITEQTKTFNILSINWTTVIKTEQKSSKNVKSQPKIKKGTLKS